MSIWLRHPHSPQTSYWPLCPGRRLSQEAMWHLQGITVNLKRGKKGFIPEECTSLHDCSRIPHQTLSKGELHYNTSYGCEAIETWRLNPWWKSYLNWTDVNVRTHCWWFLGTNRTGMDFLSLSFACRTCFMFVSVFFPFFLFFGGGPSSCCLRRMIYLHFFQGRGKEIVSSSLTCVDL